MSNLIINILSNNVITLPIHMFSVGANYEEGDLVRPNGADFYQILFVVDGEGILNCGDKTYKLKKGNAFFTGKDIPVSYKSTNKLISAFLSIQGDAVDMIMNHYNCNGFLFREYIDINKYLTKINEIIDEYNSKKRNSVMSSLSYSFFIDFFEYYQKDLTTMQEVALFLEKNFTKKLTMNKISKKFGISVSKLAHSFKKEFCCTVFEYIMNLRLNYAKNLISINRDYKTRDVALLCGFEDISYFCKAYKKKFGKTPKEDKE